MNLGLIADYVKKSRPYVGYIDITDKEVITDKFWNYTSTNQELIDFFFALATSPFLGVVNYRMEIIRSLTSYEFSYALITECDDPKLREPIVRILSCNSDSLNPTMFKHRTMRYVPGTLRPVTGEGVVKLDEPLENSEFLGCFHEYIVICGSIFYNHA